MKANTEKGYETEFHHIPLRWRGHVDEKTFKIFCDHLAFLKHKLNQIIKDIQKSAEKESIFLYLVVKGK